jgi:hypothetical protein
MVIIGKSAVNLNKVKRELEDNQRIKVNRRSILDQS